VSLKYKIPSAILAVFAANIVILLLFARSYAIPYLSEIIDRHDEAAMVDAGEIGMLIDGGTYENAMMLLTAQNANDSHMFFELTGIHTRQTLYIPKRRQGIVSFSAVTVVTLSGQDYVLLLKNKLDVWGSLDGPEDIMILIEFFVLFASLVIVACIIHSRYVKPLVRLKNEMDDYQKLGLKPKESKRRDELGALERSFFQLAGELKKEKENQNRMIASISHDIKTPLTSVMGFSERLMTKDLSREKQTAYLTTIYSQAKSIENIVNEFDEFISSSMESKLNLKRVEVGFLCDSICDEYTEIMRDKGVGFQIDNNCAKNAAVKIDGEKLRRVFTNIYGNSLRHNENDGLTLRLTAQETSDGVLLIAEDNGKGVTENDMEHIFEPFYTSDKSRKVSGLGLSICQQIVKAHGGTISAANTGHGFAVSVTIPKSE